MRRMTLFLIILLGMLFGCQQEPVETPIESLPTEPAPTEPTPDPIEGVFAASRELTNYTITIDIYHQSDVLTTVLKVTSQASSMAIGSEVEYFEKNEGVCTRQFLTTHGYVKETIDCQTQQTKPYGFFESFQKSWFTVIDGIYYLNIQNYDVIQAFFEPSLPGFSVSNVELRLGLSHFAQLKMDLQNETLLYRLDIVFSDIGTTTVVVPSVG